MDGFVYGIIKDIFESKADCSGEKSFWVIFVCWSQFIILLQCRVFPLNIFNLILKVILTISFLTLVISLVDIIIRKSEGILRLIIIRKYKIVPENSRGRSYEDEHFSISWGLEWDRRSSFTSPTFWNRSTKWVYRKNE